MPTSIGWLAAVSPVLLFAVGGCSGGVGIADPKGDAGGVVYSDGGGILGDDDSGFDDGGADGGVDNDAEPIDPRCGVYSGIANDQPCGATDLVCPYASLTDCYGNEHPLYCRCDGRSWGCEVGTTNCGGNPGTITICPPSNAVYPGGYCSSAGESCTSSQIAVPTCTDSLLYTTGQCLCTGSSWECPTRATPPCAPATQPCPSPAGVMAFRYCNTDSSMTCAGNPQDCDGETFYDAFQCDNHSWFPIASTVCPVEEAGSFDGSSGVFFDAGH
jgi:hypothetical protein